MTQKSNSTNELIEKIIEILEKIVFFKRLIATRKHENCYHNIWNTYKMILYVKFTEILCMYCWVGFVTETGVKNLIFKNVKLITVSQ